MAEIANLVTTRPEAEIALDIKKEAETKLLELCHILDKANRAGFVIGFSVGVVPGRNIIQNLIVSKNY